MRGLPLRPQAGKSSFVSGSSRQWQQVVSSRRKVAPHLSTLSRPPKRHLRGELRLTLALALALTLKQHLRGERNAEELLDAAAAASSCGPRF